MATSYDLGKVILTPKGEYNPNTQYYKLDIVRSSGSSYIVLKDAIGITPAEGEYYTLLVQKGNTGATGRASTVTVGTVTEVPAGGQIAVTNTGTEFDAILNFTLAKGNLWYTGTAIIGTSTTPTAYATGIANAGVGDLYLNISVGDNQGNVYRCTYGGAPSDALWKYEVSIVATAANMVSYLEQSATASQKLQARQNIDAVGTSRTVNGKALTSDVTISADDIPTETEDVSVQDALDTNATAIETVDDRVSDMLRIGTVSFTTSGWSSQLSATATQSSETITTTINQKTFVNAVSNTIGTYVFENTAADVWVKKFAPQTVENHSTEGATVVVVASTFASQLATAGTYRFAYVSSATSWQYNSTNVDLTTYGITFTEGSTALADGDYIDITLSYPIATLTDYGMVIGGTISVGDTVSVAVAEVEDVYKQTPTIVASPTTTANTKIDLQTSYSQIQQLLEDGTTAMYVENDNNTFLIYCVGEKPSVNMSLQALFTEI